MFIKSLQKRIWLLLLFASLLIAGCTSEPAAEVDDPSQGSETVPTQTEVPTLEPSLTPIDFAIQVNGMIITTAEFQAELARYLAAVGTGTELATTDEEIVVQELVNQLLLAQAAQESGFAANETIVQQRIDQLDIGDQALQDWLTDHGYTQESFRLALARSIAAAWMRDKIIADVPKTAEQVHAHQILLYNSEEADDVYAQLSAGTDFETLVEQYDPRTKGELGWFPRGYLTVPELDDVIFALEPGEYSSIIETRLGFHIIQVIERDDNYPLDFSSYQVVQKIALENWLNDRLSQSEVKYNLP